MARPAASAALAANRQGRFWDYHDKVFQNYSKLSEELLADIARELGLDMIRFETDRKSVEINNIINRDLREAVRIGVKGTPTLYINGKKLEKRSLETITSAIESELGTDRRP
jgi:protein-disulfide isomerase